MVEPADLVARWQTFIAAGPNPLLAVRCVTEGHGRMLMAVYAFEGRRIIVTDMHDARYRIVDRSYTLAPPESPGLRYEAWQRGERIDVGRGDLRVPGFDDPIVNDMDSVRFPMTVRCAKHGDVQLARAQLTSELANASTRRTKVVRVHPRPSASG